jgi:hypothetical protein
LSTRRQASARARWVSTARGGSRRPLGPGPHLPGRFLTAPQPFAPQWDHRPAADRQVAHPDGAAVRVARTRSPHSPPRWPRSGRRAAARHPPARPRRPGSRAGRAAPAHTHYCADPPGASACWTIRHPQDMRDPRCRSGRLHRRQHHTAPRFMRRAPARGRGDVRAYTSVKLPRLHDSSSVAQVHTLH